MARGAAITLSALGVLFFGPLPHAHAAPPRSVPVLYCTDLFHPHDDPDDHFDLATLFALEELEVLGIVLDQGAKQLQKPGATPVRQMAAITGRQVPYAIGLARALQSPQDDGADQPEQSQAGVELILTTLREAKAPVTVFTTGSVRDVGAAFNRQPELFRAKVRHLYLNIGNGSGEQKEYNVGLDREAYRRLMASDLPIYWCPCFGAEGYGTWWKLRQGELFDRLAEPLRAYFAYCLMRMPVALDPVAAVRSPGWTRLTSPDWKAATWAAERSMWCTGPMIHAAGRRVYRTDNDKWEALSEEQAKAGGVKSETAEDIFAFEPVRVSIDDDWNLTRTEGAADATTLVFRVRDPDQYPRQMRSCLTALLAGLSIP